MGLAVMIVILLIVAILLIFCNIRIAMGDAQMAADSLADGVAVYMANENGDYTGACAKAEEIRRLIESETGIILEEVNLDEASLENNEAKITATAAGNTGNGGLNIPSFSYRITKSAVTQYRIRSTMSTIYGVDTYIDYVQWAIDTAEDDTHGYCLHDVYQGNGHPDYDCSSFVSAALRENGYITGGFSTGSEYSVLTAAGFICLAYSEIDLKPGDILYRPISIINGTRFDAHTEIYVGNGWVVGAHLSEDAGSNYCYGQPGDQTGQEISVELNNSQLKGWTKIYRLANN